MNLIFRFNMNKYKGFLFYICLAYDFLAAFLATPHSEGMGKVMFSPACLSVCSQPGGYLHPADRGHPIWLTGMVPLARADRCTPSQDRMGVPPSHWDWMGVLLPSSRQSSRASTCYTAGSMPLTFTQEDFLFIFGNRRVF